VYRSGPSMKPVFDAAKRQKMRLVFAEGNDERVLRAAPTIVDENLGFPVLVGREVEIGEQIGQLSLRLVPGRDYEVVDPGQNLQHIEEEYCDLKLLHGTTGSSEEKPTSNTLVAAMYVRRGLADAMICGTRGTYYEHLACVRDVIGTRPGVSTLAAVNMLMLTDRRLFVCDTYVNPVPTTEQIVEMTLLAAEKVKDFGLKPSVALLSHSSFGSSDAGQAKIMREAVAI